MATTPQALADAGSCYSCGGLTSMADMMELALLAQISLAANPANDVSVQGLMTQAACYECATMASQAQLLKLALLAQIAGG